MTADASGALFARVPIPADACQEPRIEVLVNQAGFEPYTPTFYGLAQVTMYRDGPAPQTPGPPDTGSGLLAPSDEGHRTPLVSGQLIAGFGAAGAGAALIAKNRSSSRRHRRS